jgi:hypothetical protein
MRLLVRVCVCARPGRVHSLRLIVLKKERVKADYTHLQRIFEGGNMTPPSLPHRGFYFSLRENRECVCVLFLFNFPVVNDFWVFWFAGKEKRKNGE